ncbi:T9SS type A sorting domain-containing protein [Snuella lapsa]|uniref:Secretion system C-terminal sorting domain-containing protein n=1 Tax=Snuella lapsa TaxID=870481 RepID=A0ABP6XYL5_9FLAO
MKQIYLLFFAALSFNFLSAQTCPPTTLNNGDTVFFIDETNSINCFEMPSTITIEGSTYTGVSCSGDLITYKLDAGGTQASDTDNFDVDFGGGTICSYSDNTLPVEKIDFIKRASLRLSPNPVTDNDLLNVELAINTSAKIYIYSLTGVLVLKSTMGNVSSKKIEVSGLKNGIYILKLETNTFSATRKFVVAN